MKKQVTLITNICFEPYLTTYIKTRCLGTIDELLFDTVSFEEYRGCNDKLEAADVIVICLNFETLYLNLSNDVMSGNITYSIVEKDCINKCRELYTFVKRCYKSHIIWFGFEDYYLRDKNYGALLAFDGLVDKLNVTLNSMIERGVFVDLKRLIANAGLRNSYDFKGMYRWNAPYSKEMVRLIADEIYKQDLISSGNTKKCLVLDCDNVLWGGVLSEDGIEGIHVGEFGLGRPFQDFQRYLLDLYYHGVILTVCSKNDESDVLRVFSEHTGMLLKKEYIAYFSCNWNNKPDNIKTISKILNIGLDSMVFVDDSIFEINSVKSVLPEVQTVLYERENVYDSFACFNLKKMIDLKTVQERTYTYITNKQREELRERSFSYEDYISSLEMNVDIHRTKECELARVSELTQRTNKCTNAVRYTVEQLKCKANDARYELYTVCLEDRFSNLGIVGVIGFQETRVDVFALSCRALGRGIEERMMDWLFKKGVNIIRFVPIVKNEYFRSIIESIDTIDILVDL